MKCFGFDLQHASCSRFNLSQSCALSIYLCGPLGGIEMLESCIIEFLSGVYIGVTRIGLMAG